MPQPKKKPSGILSYYLPGIVLLGVAGIVFLILSFVPVYVYLSSLAIAAAVHHVLVRRRSHPWQLTEDEIEVVLGGLCF